jgi:DNA-binding transcriptional LysR family regulator
MPFRRDHIRYFVAVAEEGQLTRAAAKLHLTQPALSEAIAHFEADLGVNLFERHHSGVTLTAAGEQLFEKARSAVAASDEIATTAEALSRAETGTIVFGFLGAAPGLDSPAALQAFCAAHPNIELRYQEIPFPTVPTRAWLSSVDVAACHLPPADPEVLVHPLRAEPRAVLAPRDHPLVGRGEVAVEDVIDETFIGLHPAVEPAWAGFWSLDDHRGQQPLRVTRDHAANPQEVIAALAVRDAVTTVPASIAHRLAATVPALATIPLRDAAPATVALVGHATPLNPLVESLLSFARKRAARTAAPAAAWPVST